MSTASSSWFLQQQSVFVIKKVSGKATGLPSPSSPRGALEIVVRFFEDPREPHRSLPQLLVSSPDAA
jgi:hypothetical protein